MSVAAASLSHGSFLVSPCFRNRVAGTTSSLVRDSEKPSANCGERDLRILTLAVALALVGAGAALAATVVKSAKNPAFGKIVVNSSGLTLYHNTKEKGSIVCTGSCAKTWPPLLVGKTAKLKVGPGVKVAHVGKIKRPDGHFQATYYGKPLYR
jgi:predicted lipoprotein with Yx(FWY)xxD motif